MFYSIFLSVVFVLVYVFSFYISSDTPIKYSSFVDKVEIFAFIVLLSVISGGALRGLLFVVDLVFLGKKKAAFKFEYFCIFTLLFFGFLLLTENWCYSLFGFGLKTSVAWWSKLLFFASAVFLSFQFTPLFVYSGKFLSTKKIAANLLIGLFVVFYFAVNGVFFIKSIGDGIEYGTIGDKLNIVILLSDGVSASEMSVYDSDADTTPFLKSIGSEFMLFENAYTNNENSTGSVISLLTGISPLTSRVVYPPDILIGESSTQSLPRILGGFGYYRSLWGVPHYVDSESQNLVNAFDSNIVRNLKPALIDEGSSSSFLNDKVDLPSVQRWFLTRASKDYLGVISDVFFLKELDNPFFHVADETSFKKSNEGDDDRRISNLLQDIDNGVETGTPFFSFTHLMKTHGAKFRPKSRVFSKGKIENKPWMREFYRDAILDFDKKISIVYNKLKDTNQLDRTILIITSDHGMRWSNNKRIPLLIRWPNSKRSGRYNVNVQLLDIAPTILEALEVDVPLWMEGGSLLSPKDIAADRFILSAGVLGSTFANGNWVRDSENDLKFTSGNTFSVVYCDFFMKSTYPLDFSPSTLADRVGEADCPRRNIDVIKADAEKLVTEIVN